MLPARLRLFELPFLTRRSLKPSRTSRCFSSTPKLSLAKPLPPRPKLSEADIEESFLKGSGPGGQKINKTSSAVQLHHTPTGLVVKCQATRSRSQNRKIARQLLAEKLELAEKGEDSRVAIKAEVKRKKKASAGKKSRRKYRALEAGKEGGKQDEREEEGKELENEMEEEVAEDDAGGRMRRAAGI